MRTGVAFIIPAYNSQAFIREAVGSVFDGNFETGDELIVVDDASTDGTVAVIRELQIEHPELQLLQHRHNRGLGAAGMNTGIEAAENDLVFCLDHDNVLVPGCIEPLRRAIASETCDAACFAEVRYFLDAPNGRQSRGKWVYKEGVISLADALAGRYWPGPSGNYLFSRDSWLKAGRYDEAVSPAVDCWDFGIRQLATGCRMQTIPETHYRHRQGLESQWVTGSRGQSISLLSLRTMLPILPLLAAGEERYLLTRFGRRRWMRNLQFRPIRTQAEGAGRTGHAVDSDGIVQRDTETTVRKARRILGQTIGI
jgi:hypothetical protein